MKPTSKNDDLKPADDSNSSKLPAVQRRSFLKSTAALATIPYFAWSQPAFANTSKNDRPRIGCIGLGGMGRGDAKQHVEFGDIVAICDVDQKHVDRAVNDKDIGKGKADGYKDYRKVLERDDIDIVSIVTPDHWHVKQAIEALQAGKHVFCQKPLTLTLEENKLIRAACEKHKDKTFFVGTQQRSSKPKFLRAVNMVRKGLLGNIKKVTVGIDGGQKGGPFAASKPPKNMDWDMWQGSAPATESDAKHPVELKDGYPVVNDSFNTSHDFNIVCKYADGLEMHITSREQNGILFEGTKGRMFVNRRKAAGTPIEKKWDSGKYSDDDLVAFYKGKPFEGHKNNFYRCIQEGGLPVSDVFTHVNMLNICHLSVIAARLGRKIEWDPKAELIVGDDQATAMASRTSRSGFEMPSV